MVSAINKTPKTKEGIKKKGLSIFAPMPNKIIEVEITNPVFIDPSNERLSV